VECISYQPSNSFKQQTWHDFTEALKKEVESKQVPWLKGEVVPFLFITGPMRDWYERAVLNEKLQMDVRVNEALNAYNKCPKIGNSFFLPHKLEAELECVAAQTMYANASRKKLIPEAQVCGTLAVGSANTRLYFAQSGVDFFACRGLEQDEKLDDCCADISTFKSFLSDAAIRNRLCTLLKNTSFPTLALKAGSLLLLNAEAKVRTAMFSPGSFIFDYLRGTFYLPKSSTLPLILQLEQLIHAVQEHIGLIVRIKDQTNLGFILMNVLFTQAVEGTKKSCVC
jgi:hypothetical protein